MSWRAAVMGMSINSASIMPAIRYSKTSQAGFIAIRVQKSMKTAPLWQLVRAPMTAARARRNGFARMTT